MISKHIRQHVLAMRRMLRFLLPASFAAILILAVFFPGIRLSVLVSAITGLVAAEIVLRLMGLLDFPLYDADNIIGYIPRANQQGCFLRKNDWRFNAQHMDAGIFTPDAAVDTLLIGDSVVLGGTLYPPQQRLGACLQTIIHGHVWPVAAGSWGLLNALTYLRLHPDVTRRVKQIVIVVNSEDFGQASSWSCELRHPRTRPLSAVVYFFQRYLNAKQQLPAPPAALQVPPQDIATELHAFLQQATRQKIIFVLYPQHDELLDPHLLATRLDNHRALLQAAGVQHVISVAADPRWDAACYRDHIHPTATGNQRLAQIIADHLPQP